MLVEASSFGEAMEHGCKLHHGLRASLKARGHKQVNIGLNGGHVPAIEEPADAMQVPCYEYPPLGADRLLTAADRWKLQRNSGGGACTVVPVTLRQGAKLLRPPSECLWPILCLGR